MVLNATTMASTLKYKTKVAGPDHFLILQTWISNCLPAIANSVQFRHSVMSDSLRPNGLQHVRLPCPLPTPRAYSNSCLSSWWCHPTVSSCRPLLLLPSIFPSIGVFSNESTLSIRYLKLLDLNFLFTVLCCLFPHLEKVKKCWILKWHQFISFVMWYVLAFFLLSSCEGASDYCSHVTVIKVTK